jgi:cytidylate kinase
MTKIITIDGPAASGKGTLARRLASHLDYFYLDTGAMYRLVGLAVINADINPDHNEGAVVELTTNMAQTFRPDDTNNPNLKRDDVGQMASRVAALSDVRTAVLELQRSLANTPPTKQVGSIMDGRDCGTVVCPDADIKFYITADVETRAKRRHAELQSRGDKTKFDAVLTDMKMRDDRDMNRATAPLKPADDAITIDTTTMDADAAFQKILGNI